MSGDPYTQAFGALQRLLLVVDPAYGEGRWQQAHSFEKLTEEQRAPGHWYRGEGSGFIHVDRSLNGQYVKALPPDVDPAEVIALQPASHATVLDTMRTLLPDIDAERRPAFEKRLAEMTKTAQAEHRTVHVRNYQHLAFAAMRTAPAALLEYLNRSAEYHYGEGLREGTVSASEAGAALLIRDLAEGASKAGGSQLTRLWGRLAAPGAVSLEMLAARTVQDAIQLGFAEPAADALAGLLREGNGRVDAAREGFHPAGRPQFMLEFYYFGLFGAAPYLRAAMIGYEAAVLNPALDEGERRKLAVRANAAEEKLARVTDAMLFAVQDLDGSRFRIKRAAIQRLLAAGDEDGAQGLAMEAVDLQLFFPKPFKQALLRRDS